MSQGCITKRTVIKREGADIAAGQTLQTFSTLSLVQGGIAFAGVRCVVILGDVTATALAHLKAYQGKDSGGSDKAALSGTAAQAAAGASDQDDKMLIVDVYKPLEPYITFELVRGTANVAVDAVFYEFYEPREEPVTQDATVLDNDCLVEPDEA